MPFYNQYQNPYMFPQPQIQMQMPQQQQANAQQPAQIQNGGFISVRSEIEARNYPVVPGNCVTFKIEGQPIVIEKSMGFSQFEAPHIDVYELVKKDTPVESKMAQNDPQEIKIGENANDEIKAEIEEIRADIDALKTKVAGLLKVKTTTKEKNNAES